MNMNSIPQPHDAKATLMLQNGHFETFESEMESHISDPKERSCVYAAILERVVTSGLAAEDSITLSSNEDIKMTIPLRNGRFDEFRSRVEEMVVHPELRNVIMHHQLGQVVQKGLLRGKGFAVTLRSDSTDPK